MQDRLLVWPLVLPRSGISEVLVVALRFPVSRLEFLAEMAPAGFLAVPGVLAHELGQFEEVGKQNIALFERALKMLAPYGREEKPAPPDPEAKQTEGEDPRLKRLEAQIDTLTRQLDQLGRDRQNR